MCEVQWSGIGHGRLQTQAVLDVVSVCGVNWSRIGQGRLHRLPVVDAVLVCVCVCVWYTGVG